MSDNTHSDTPLRATVTIVNQRGLHARASAKFVALAGKFPCEITVVKDGNGVSGRSIMGLMMLGAGLGSTVEITAQGPQAEEALAQICALIAGKFNEDA